MGLTRVHFPFRLITGLDRVAQHEVWRNFQELAKVISDAPAGVLGHAKATTNQTGIGTSAVDLTDLEVEVFVPAGRLIQVTAVAVLRNLNGVANAGHLLVDGDGTTLQDGDAGLVASGAGVAQTVISMTDVFTPDAGTHIYKAQALFGSGAANRMDASSTQPAHISVEDLGAA
jgi:hypothetical protein